MAINATKAGFRPGEAKQQVVVTTPTRFFQVTLALTPTAVWVGAPVTAEIQVRDDQNNPAAGAEVGLSWDDGTSDSKVPCDDRGACSVGHIFGSPGTYTVSVTASGAGFGAGKNQKEVEVSWEVPPLGDIVLGDRVSSEELGRLARQGGLTEDEQRDRLASEAPFTYPLSCAVTHTAIFGTTGSGKSVTTRRLVREFVSRGVNVLVLDWHDEYAGLIQELGGKIVVPPTAITSLEATEEPFTWNLLDPHFYSPEVSPGVIEDYTRIVVDLLSHKDLMDLSEPMRGGLTDALKLAYRQTVTPTFEDVEQLLTRIAVPPATADALRRRVRSFSTGSLGRIFCHATTFDPQSVFQRPVCVRVKHLTNEHRPVIGLLTFFLLRQAVGHFKRLGEAKGQERVRHVIH